MSTIQHLRQNILQKERNDIFHQDHQRLPKRGIANLSHEIQPLNRTTARNEHHHFKETINPG